ncbi:MAG: carbohydrate kinase family protein [Leadbetterella sp.]
MKYKHIVGTGGVGTGMFFSLQGDHDLGREESRMAKLEAHRDFCKMHIILHYIATLVPAESEFKVYPIGSVGNDDAGQMLLYMMKKAGMNIDAMYVSATERTLLSVCFQYPDHSGGNITTSNSASDSVSAGDILHFFEKNTHLQEGIVVAVPEVPIDTRLQLLKEGRKRNYLNVASLQNGEAEAFRDKNIFQYIDVLSINQDEGRAIAFVSQQSSDEELIQELKDYLIPKNESIKILLTLGAKGSYYISKTDCYFTPANKSQVVSTAGAGDAFLAGVITGLVLGLPYFGEGRTAVQLGTTLASYSVRSADTIHFGVNAHFLENHFS